MGSVQWRYVYIALSKILVVKAGRNISDFDLNWLNDNESRRNGTWRSGREWITLSPASMEESGLGLGEQYFPLKSQWRLNS